MSLKQVSVGVQSLEGYEGIIPRGEYDEVRRLGDKLRGRAIAHVNATAGGGGVAEVLRSLVPLMKGTGLEARWYITEAPESFFEITKKLHNLLQGSEEELSGEEKEEYLHWCEEFAWGMEREEIDIWVVHDPQPLAVFSFLNGRHKCKLWRSHINTSSPNQMALEFVLPHLQIYDYQIFTLPEFAPPGLSDGGVVVFAPAIDPLTEKNREIPRQEADTILKSLGIGPDRPLATQVSRFDRWKDPIGVIDVYRGVKPHVPELQLALVGVFSATDDPEAPRVYAQVEDHRAGDEDIHLYKDPRQVGDREVNAFQTGSDVIMQKSIREGFGLTVAEAMWKGSSVIGGNTGGIRHQIDHGVNSFLADNVEEACHYLRELLKDNKRREDMGRAAKETVRRHFLLPRLLRDYLTLWAKCT